MTTTTEKMRAFADGVVDVINKLANRRSAVNNTVFRDEEPLSNEELRAAYKIGIHNKVIRTLTSDSLGDGLTFDNTIDGEFFKKKLAHHVSTATTGMLAFRRGVIVCFASYEADRVSEPLNPKIPREDLIFRSFFGDVVSPYNVTLDLTDDNYLRPEYYNIRGVSFHHSRVVDFTYVRPPDQDAPLYLYGGISLTELVARQLKIDMRAEDAGISLLIKASTLVQKIKGFRDNIKAGLEEDISNYVANMEDLRSIYGSMVVDAEDDVVAVSQQLSNLADVLDSSLRRLAAVYGVPITVLVGENVRGLNGSGDVETEAYDSTINGIQDNYLTEPLTKLGEIAGFSFKFTDNQGGSPNDRAAHEGVLLDNALKLYELGQDHEKYLADKGVVIENDWGDLFDKLGGGAERGTENPEL